MVSSRPREDERESGRQEEEKTSNRLRRLTFRTEGTQMDAPRYIEQMANPKKR